MSSPSLFREPRMTIEAKIIADSINSAGIRLTTMQLRYPRFIHAEELTHRILETQPELIIYEAIPDGFMYDPNLSRNASSSRAIPVNRMIEDLRRDPAMPIYWGGHQAGMQAAEELTGAALQLVQSAWIGAMEDAIGWAEKMVAAGLHKQIANRILEPWAHINVVVTATDWENFFTLRRHKDAQPEIKLLADRMFEAMEASVPDLLYPGQWHLPYVDDATWSSLVTGEQDDILELAKKVSVARCARVSYLTHDGRQTTVEEDILLFDRLVGAQPLHASPAEHQATPLICHGTFPHSITNEPVPVFQAEHLQGNLRGWGQLRKMLPGEFVPG
jgi:hypothetical protein